MISMQDNKGDSPLVALPWEIAGDEGILAGGSGGCVDDMDCVDDDELDVFVSRIRSEIQV